MLTTHRKSLLMERLLRDGQLTAANLALEWNVSEDTIRRDLRSLAAEGKLLRVHGGALPVSPTHIPLNDRRGLQVEAKARLASAAAALIQPGMTVIVDGGTTHLALIQALPPSLTCTIVTHSPTIAAALEPLEKVDIHLIGGRMFRHSMVALGPVTQSAYARLHADLCFLGVTGLHGVAGLTTGDAEEAQLKSTMLAAAAETVVMATPDKVGTVSPWQIAAVSEVTTVVTTGERPDWLPSGVIHLAA